MTPIKFLKTALTDYKVGALTSSSRFVARRIIREMPPQARLVLEYGAGDGYLTRALLDYLPEDARVVAIERNPQFAHDLGSIFDERLIIYNGNVLDFLDEAHRLGTADVHAVVSGIPFTFFKQHVRHEIVRKTYGLLAPGGKFIIYQHSRLVMPHLTPYFAHVKSSYEPRNFLPYFIMSAEKGSLRQHDRQ